MVDWSASSTPKRGADSVWWCEVSDGVNLRNLHNPSTRAQACEEILAALLANVEANQRVLVGFDFPYGYPSGWAKALGLSGAPWGSTWNDLSERIQDAVDNRNNRFQVAADLNKCASGGPFPFWGCPNSVACQMLSPRSQWRQPPFNLG